MTEQPIGPRKPLCDVEVCREPSVISDREHLETGMPHRCAHHLYEPGTDDDEEDYGRGQ
jgi:hypothetical protein